MLTKAQVQEIREDVGSANRRLTMMFSALSDKGRFSIFRLFMQHRDICVTEVADVLRISVPAASQQLKVMELSGLVAKKREGQKVCYAVKRGDSVVCSLMRIVSHGGGL